MNKDKISNSRVIDGLKIKNGHLYSLRVDEIFRKNTVVLKKLYEQSHLASSKFLSPEDCIMLAKKATLNLTD